MEAVLNSYDSKTDSKNRITLRHSIYRHFFVKELENGTIILEPRVLVSPFEVSKNTLKMMDKSMGNLKKGKVGKEIKV